MKFIAILRDSVREALDAKVIYFLFGLSALIILVMLTISFTPESPENGIHQIVENFPGSQAPMFSRQPPPMRYEVEGFKQINSGKPAWEGEYQYEIKVTEAVPLTEDEEGAGGKDKAKKLKPGTLFRLIVMQTLLAKPTDDDLEEEDKQLRKRMRDLQVKILLQGGKMTQAEAQKLGEAVLREAEAMTPGQLERFVQRSVGAQGTLQVRKVELTKQEENVFQFQVDCKASEGAIRTWPHSMSLFFGGFPWPFGKLGVGIAVFTIQDSLVAGIGGSIGLLLSVIVTSFFIPNMLRKGTIDLLIAKPIHRTSLLLCKYIGGLSFMVLTTGFTILGIWVVLGLRSGIWPTGFLLSLLVLIFQFALFYAISLFIGVFTRSPILSILICAVCWFVLWLVGVSYSALPVLKEGKVLPEAVTGTIETTHFLLPRYKDLDTLASRFVIRDIYGDKAAETRESNRLTSDVRWDASIGVTLGYIAVLLALSCWWFSRKDY